VADRIVTIEFKGSGETRRYARANAPLQRVHFRAGDTIKTRADKTFTVRTVEVREEVLVYRCDGADIPETDLSDTIAFDAPEERLLAGQVDTPKLFDLRVTALRHQHERRKSAVRGF